MKNFFPHEGQFARFLSHRQHCGTRACVLRYWSQHTGIHCCLGTRHVGATYPRMHLPRHPRCERGVVGCTLPVKVESCYRLHLLLGPVFAGTANWLQSAHGRNCGI